MTEQKPTVIIPAIETAPYLDAIKHPILFYLSETEAKTFQNVMGIYPREEGWITLKIANGVDWSSEEIVRGEDVAKIVLHHSYEPGFFRERIGKRSDLRGCRLEFLCHKKDNPYVRTSIGIYFAGLLYEPERIRLFYSPWYDTLNGPNHSGGVAIPRLSLPEQYYEVLLYVAAQVCKNARFKPNEMFKSLPFIVRHRLRGEFKNSLKNLEAIIHKQQGRD